MKKFIAVILASLTIFSLFGGITVFGANDVSVICTDDLPISAKEVGDSRIDSVFRLDGSMFDYSFDVVLPDNSRKPLKAAKDITAEDRKDVLYLSYGEAYIDFEEFDKALNDKSATVPVHIDITLSKRDAASGDFIVQDFYKFTVHKQLVQSFISSITPKENVPDYIFAGSESAIIDETLFEIVYWNGTRKEMKPVRVSCEEKPEYTLDGEPLSYDVNHRTAKVYISYIDSSCTYGAKEIREIPFASIEILDCVLQGDMPVKLVYQIKHKGSAVSDKYTKTVNAYSGYIDFIDGYPVTYSTEGSKYVSTVEISVGNILKTSKTYELEQQSLLQRIIAKIVWFFKQIFAAGIF